MTAPYYIDAKVRELLRGPLTHADLAAALREAREKALRMAAATAEGRAASASFFNIKHEKAYARGCRQIAADLTAQADALLAPTETETPYAG